MAIASDTRTVVGVFNSVQDAQAAVRELESTGVSRESISIVANKNAVGYDTMDAADRDKASDVVADAGIGAAIGGVGGLLLSAAGAITIPVIGPILAAGPIAAALTGAGIGAAAGGLIGALTESGIPEDHAKFYAEGVRRGDVLVTVRADETRANQVCDILDRHNAIDVDERVKNWRERGWSGYQTDANPYSEEELRTERGYYRSGYNKGTLTGESGIAVDRERSNLSRDVDDLTPPVGTTRRTNEAGDIGTSGTVGTTGMTGAGLGTGYRDRDADYAGPGDLSSPGGTYSGGAAGEPITGAGHSTPDVTRDRPSTGTWADTTRGARHTGEQHHDDRGLMERAGDKMHEWKEDLKNTGRDLRDEARDNERTTREYNAESRDNYPGTSAWADETRGDFGSVDTRKTGSEIGRDLKEAGRDTSDILHGRTGRQPHDVAEDRREAERDRLSSGGIGGSYGTSQTPGWSEADRERRSGPGSSETSELGRDLKEAGRDVKDVLHGRTGKQPHDLAEERREAERRRRARVYDRTII